MQIAERGFVSGDITEEIGNTPIVDVSRFSPNPEVRLLAKLESENPTGSVKDRVALSLINQAESDGLLVRGSGGVILEPTSGNTGIGLALIGRLRGYQVKAVMPESVSPERVQLLEGFGADVIFSAAEKGTNESINVAKELALENPSWFMPYQYGNQANPKAHYNTTGPEIARDVPDIDMFVAGLGTGGTLMGVAKALREHNPDVKIVAAAPHPDDKVQGLRSIEHGFIPPVLDLDALDARIMVEAEESFFWTKKLLIDAGVFVGVSSGAVLASAIRAARRFTNGTIVMLFADGGWKYLSTGIYTRAWSDIQNDVEGQTWW
jgi:cysteine synthase B